MTQEFWYDGRLYEVGVKDESGIALVRLPNNEMIQLHMIGDTPIVEPLMPGMFRKAYLDVEEASEQLHGVMDILEVGGKKYYAMLGRTAFLPNFYSFPDGSVWIRFIYEENEQFVRIPVLHAQELETVAFRVGGRKFRTKRPAIDYYGFSWLVIIDTGLYQLTHWFNGIDVTRIDVNVAVPADSGADLYN